MLSIVLDKFGLQMGTFVFFDLWGLYSPATVYGLLKSWWFRGFLQIRLFFWLIKMFVWFYDFDC